MSLSQYYYAKTLVKKGLVKNTFKSKNLKEYEVTSKENKFIVQKNFKGYSCDCPFGSLWKGNKEKECCHIKAVKIMEEK